MKRITPELFKLVENEDTKIAQRVHDNVLARDKVNVFADDNYFWIERVTRYTNVPDYAYNYIISLLERNGYHSVN